MASFPFCCFTADVVPLDSNRLPDDNMHSDLFEDGDLCEDEIDLYEEKIKKNIEDMDCISLEMKIASTMNYPQKLTVLCKSVVHDKNIKLHSEKLLGPNNQTLLHRALGLNNYEASKVLIKYGCETLIMAEMEGKEYGGITALHLAIVNGQTELLKEMLEMLEHNNKVNYVNSQSYGNFYNGFLNVSNVPLGLALWCGYTNIYDILVEAGAEVDATDNQTGNTILNSLVLYSSECLDLMINMIDHVLSSEATRKWWCRKKNIPEQEFKFGPMHWKFLKKYLLSIPNNEGYTPLTAAAMIGVPEMLSHLYNINQVYKNTLWTYGPASGSLFDVSATDPLVVDIGDPSVLEHIVYQGKDTMLPIMTSEPIKSLVNAKWKSHKMIYYGWFLFYLTLMSVFTWWVIERPQQDVHDTIVDDFLPAEISETASLYVELIIDIAAAIFIIAEIIDIISSCHDAVQYRLRRGSTGYYKAPWSVIFNFDEYRVVNLIFSISTIIASILRQNENENADIFYCLALTTGWYYMLSFCRTFKHFSYYTIMVHRIVVSDIFRFLVVFMFLLLGFTAGNMVIFAQAPNGVPDQTGSFHECIFALFRLMIGLEEWDITSEARSIAAAKVVFIFFITLTTILLLNMLIASMTDTYASVTNLRENLRLRYIALTALTIERRMMPLAVCSRYKASAYLSDSTGKGNYTIFVHEVDNSKSH